MTPTRHIPDVGKAADRRGCLEHDFTASGMGVI
jgi:hypothetical protein